MKHPKKIPLNPNSNATVKLDNYILNQTNLYEK
jgi:hypothetical protein